MNNSSDVKSVDQVSINRFIFYLALSSTVDVKYDDTHRAIVWKDDDLSGLPFCLGFFVMFLPFESLIFFRI
jgi:hypothetical protein